MKERPRKTYQPCWYKGCNQVAKMSVKRNDYIVEARLCNQHYEQLKKDAIQLWMNVFCTFKIRVKK